MPIDTQTGLNAISKYLATQGKTVAPTVEAIRAFNEPKKEIPIEKPVLPNVGGEGIKGEVEKPTFDISSLISASKPAINEADIQAQSQRELTAKKGIIESRYGVKIGEAKEQSAQEERALEGQLGTRRRFSSSASAFLQFVDEKNKKEIATMEVQKQDALASADFEYAQLVENRIAKARQQSQQEFENMFKIIEFADKKQAEETKSKDAKAKAMEPYIKSAKDSFTLKMLESGETDMSKILDGIRTQFPDATFDDVAKIQKGMAEANSEIRKQEASDFVSDALASGLKDVNDIYRQARLSGIKIDAKDIAGAVKDLQVVEKAAPGIIGEWMALKENAPEFKDLTLEGYLNMKDPTRALDVKEKLLRIKEMEKKLEDMPGAIIGADEKIIPTAKDARIINKELTTKDEFKVIRKGQDSLQFLLDFEKAFDKYGLQTIPGKGKGELSTKYQTTLLNLKEFFNLGVLNGPDLKVLEGILPNPTKMPEIFGFIPFSKKLSGVKSKTTEGIKALKDNISKTLDDRYASLSTQYGDYSPKAINGLKDLNRIYIEQKSLLNPEIKKMIDENPELTNEDIIQLIQNK